MKIAVFHNYYHLRGGEDVMFELECDALEKAGHTVFPFSMHNTTELTGSSIGVKARTAWQAACNSSSRQRVLDFLQTIKPDISHVHNWFPLLSPSIYSAHLEASVPVVQTLHNYRLGCAAGNYRRGGLDCQLCRPGHSLPAVVNRCYRNSIAGSLAWRRMADHNWRAGTFTKEVTHYIAPSLEIARHHEQMGIPEKMISVIPNACKDPVSIGSTPGAPAIASGAVYVGRLVREKGVDVLVEAWKGLSSVAPRVQERFPDLVIVGSGPDEARLMEAARSVGNIHFKGHLPRREVDEAISNAGMLVFPSRWAEPFGLGIIEAMALGKPVIASDTGAPPEIVENGLSGILVTPEDSYSLRSAIKTLLENPSKAHKMGREGRKVYEARYRPEIYADNLLCLFNKMLDN